VEMVVVGEKISRLKKLMENGKGQNHFLEE
jgi:hypothetical protein